ncbi:MAG: hypothetical protein IJU51_04675 [Clostridia bacterium]|nr:hypothetical protein [Clostridia bacterium]
MKKLLSIIFCASLVLSLCACSENKEDDRSDRKVELTYSSEVSSRTVVSQEPSEPESSSDPLESFERIPKLPSLPDHIATNPKIYSSLLHNMMNLYYSGVLNGRITSDSVSFRYSSDILPSPDADADTRREAARYCTIGGALEYFGYDCKNYMKYYEMYNGCLPYFCYDQNANIYSAADNPKNQVLNLTDFDQALFFIYKNADKNTVERDAKSFAAGETDSAVKIYYSGIRNGTIPSSVKLAHSNDKLPPPDAAQEERDTFADNATIAGAIDYAGYYTPLYPIITCLGYNENTGDITVPDQTAHNVKAISSPETKLGTLFS